MWTKVIPIKEGVHLKTMEILPLIMYDQVENNGDIAYKINGFEREWVKSDDFSSPTRLDHGEPVGKYHVARKNSFQLVSNRTIVWMRAAYLHLSVKCI